VRLQADLLPLPDGIGGLQYALLPAIWPAEHRRAFAPDAKCA
jgi:hypothetical protein